MFEKSLIYDCHFGSPFHTCINYCHMIKYSNAKCSNHVLPLDQFVYPMCNINMTMLVIFLLAIT
jgi:hypothetical protein